MRSDSQREQQQKIHKIMKSTLTSNPVQEDRQFAEKELRKIYSEEMAKMLRSKKNFLLFKKNQESIDSLTEIKATTKLQKFNSLQERSVERRQRLLKDRMKVFKLNEKRWFLKTEAIKQNIKRQQKSMIDIAVQYRKKAEKQLDLRKTEQKQFMKQFSEKYHPLSYSNYNTQRIRTGSSESFDQSKLEQLTKRRNNRLNSLRKSTEIQESIQRHKIKERFLTESKERQNFQKLMNKLQKIEKIEIKKYQSLASSSIAKAKSRLYQKVYKNIKNEIGPNCQKHQVHEQKFRGNISKRSRSTSPINKASLKQSILKSRLSKRESFLKKNDQCLLRYCQKSRRLKLSRVIKANVRNAISSQFKDQKTRGQAFNN